MMLNPEGIPMGINATEAAPDPNAALRFEDLTIDDDLTLIERVVRYVRSGIALQRLVHVKMIAETGCSVGPTATMQRLIPLLPPLVVDSESIIRQHLAAQLLPLCLTCMFGDNKNFNPNDKSTFQSRTYNEQGYKIVTSTLLNHMNTLITDSDVDVRKTASDALATLALYIKPTDIASMILPIPLRLTHEQSQSNKNSIQSKSNGRLSEKDDNPNDDFHVTATNLLGDIASLDHNQIPPILVAQYITPTIVSLSSHPSFRVRRAAVQAIPRVVIGSSIDDVEQNLIPAFVKLSMDDMYRVRKSVGECLVDMSRSLMLLPSSQKAMSKAAKEEVMEVVMNLRRQKLVNICMQLLKDGSKFVRNGMMQFLGPFIASFYPLHGEYDDKEDTSGIIHLLSGNGKENRVGGMGIQFFPHANGMVSRLNTASVSAAAMKKEAMNSDKKEFDDVDEDSREYLESLLPEFLEKFHNDAKSLVLILHHREKYPVSREDVKVVMNKLLPPYVELATISTGDENVDAEMRVYCAYSLPAVVLLLGLEGWEMSLKKCFFALITGSSSSSKGDNEPVSVPLPVKRCLASSFHTVCHVLGPQALKGSTDEKNTNRDMLAVFEHYFLRDADDTVRLNIIRNLASFLSLLSFSKRSKYLPILYEIITGDAMLASKRKNAMNPMILNWRQRDMIAQIIPNLIILFKPSQVRQYIWPIIKVLMSDSVNHVREHVEWSIPIILRCYETKKCKYDNDDLAAASKFSAEACNEVFVFLKATLLDNKSTTNVSLTKAKSSGSFSKRQSYCRVLAAVALLLRLNDKEFRRQRKKEQRENVELPPQPFYNLSSDEYRHVFHVLQELLLPPAIAMKDDRVTNVRLVLAKCLRVMPLVIRNGKEVNVVLATLEDEIETWLGGGGQYIDGHDPNSSTSSPSRRHNKNGTSEKKDALPDPPSTPRSPEEETAAAMERGRLRAEEDERRIRLRTSEGDESESLASI